MRVQSRVVLRSVVAGEHIEAGAYPVPNKALEPTPTASARASLRLLARLTASVRPLRDWELYKFMRCPHVAESLVYYNRVNE